MKSTNPESDPPQPSAKCPLCGAEAFGPSWLGSTRYLGKEFPYVACDGCHSLYCHPMPGPADLESMYDTGYEVASDSAGSEESKPEWVLKWLDRLAPATFMDYGCGAGELLVEANRRGWEVLGVELTKDVVEETRQRTGLPVVTVEETLDEPPSADVVHAGDVLEHLTDLDDQMTRILSLVTDGGLFLAQGPLEANDNLFTRSVRLARSLGRRKPIDMPPYHVILATVDGQWALFRRSGLNAIEESVTEVSWPAPARLSANDLLEARTVGLYGLRLASRALSRLRPNRWGNRYRYAGRIE